MRLRAGHLERLADAGIDTVYFHCFDARDCDQVAVLGEALVDKMATVGPAAPGRGGPAPTA